MRTIIILIAGLVLLLAFVGITKLISKNNTGTVGKAALAFLPVWLVATGYNMWIGVTEAGYSVAEEAPILLLLFGLPASAALYLWKKSSHLES